MDVSALDRHRTGLALKKEFRFEPPARQPVGSLLYQEHIKQAASCPMATFADYIMPLWFTSIAQEHKAVREAAGLFDCTHMGILESSGPDARQFLDVVTTNSFADMEVRQARYAFLLDPYGNVLDDIVVYQRGPQQFILVVNAANEPKVRAYLEGLVQDQWIIDPKMPDQSLGFRPRIRDLRDPSIGPDGLVDIAIQGPKSLEILEGLIDSDSLFLAQMRPFRFMDGSIQKIPVLIARTGYTGSSVGFELFVEPAKASTLWNILLEKGTRLGLVPCGLGARDSLRIEAGLPLHGRELAGPFGIDPFQAGYGWAVKLQKPFFIGKAQMEKAASQVSMKVARLQLAGGKGIRPVRFKDAVLDQTGRCIGWISSSAAVGTDQIALAFIDSRYCTEGTPIGLYYLARNQAQVKEGRAQSVQKGDQLAPDLQGIVIARFARF